MPNRPLRRGRRGGFEGELWGSVPNKPLTKFVPLKILPTSDPLHASHNAADDQQEWVKKRLEPLFVVRALLAEMCLADRMRKKTLDQLMYTIGGDIEKIGAYKMTFFSLN